MSRNRRRSISPDALQTPELGQAQLETPEGSDPLLERQDDEELEPERDQDVAPEPLPAVAHSALSERQIRLAAARALPPDAAHWASVWAAGRDAAVAALDCGTSIADAHALRPPDAAGCRDCWMRGRDAALRVIQGV